MSNRSIVLPKMRKTAHTSLLSILMLGLAACGTTVQRNPLPAEGYAQATLFLDRQDLRFWGDTDMPADHGLLTDDTATLEKCYSGIMHTAQNYLAISWPLGSELSTYRRVLTTGTTSHTYFYSLFIRPILPQLIRHTGECRYDEHTQV